MDVLTPANWRVEPWRNGGGSTAVIATGRHGSRAGGDRVDWDWRLSLATIDRPGPFSRLPAVARHLALVTGGPLLLRIAGREQPLSRSGAAVRFRGGDPVEALPGGLPAQVLNLMWRPEHLHGRLEAIDLSRWRPQAPATGLPGFLHVCAGGLRWRDTHAGPGDTVPLWAGAATNMPVAASGHGILATLEPTGAGA